MPDTLINSDIKKEVKQRIIINSIGHAGVQLVSTLQHISPLPKTQLARLLYQAPAELLSDLPAKTAEEMNKLLRATGLDTQIINEHDSFVAGDSNHEIALVIKDMRYMKAITQTVVEILGVDINSAQKILCTSPTVLIGKISKNTVNALQQRFKAFNVELDVSYPDHAIFDLFIGDSSSANLQRVKDIIHEQKIPISKTATMNLLASDLSKLQADKLWDRLRQIRLPIYFLNRDFQRFDLRLDNAPDSPEMLEFLCSTTSMPEKIAKKVLNRPPVVIQQNICYREMNDYLIRIHSLQGQASGHLLAFQRFSLLFETLTHKKTTCQLLQKLGNLTLQEAMEALRNQKTASIFTNPQARWLQWELKQVGTEVKVILK